MALPNPKKNRNCLLKDLVKGQESARSLSALVNGSDHEARGLLGHILDTFSKVISAIETDEGALKEDGSIESADAKIASEISNKKRKGFYGSDQRSGSRRSRQASTSVLLTNTIDDGQAWRKYGQKEILNSKNPRSYFRCTHKFDQGCKAQKQVQKSEEDPSKFIITYMGHHTCKSHPPQTIQNFSGDNSSCLISFESNAAISNNNINDNKPGQDKTVTTPVQSLKQGGEEDMLSNLTMTDLTAGGVSDPMASTSEQAEDRGDVTSELNCFFSDPDMMMLNQIEDFASFSDYYIQFG